MGHADKATLRRELTAARAGRPADAVEAARLGVRTLVLQRAAPADWRSVAAYVPLATEPGSTALLDALAGNGVQVLVPVLLADRDLDWAVWDASAQRPGEPIGRDSIRLVDAVIVPALAVAWDGTRLGRGGGSYDRALRRVPSGVTVAALLFDGELVPHLPKDSWDVAVTAVATPGGWQELPRRDPRVAGNAEFGHDG